VLEERWIVVPLAVQANVSVIQRKRESM